MFAIIDNFNLEKTIIHCTTQDEADAIANILDDVGWHWQGDETNRLPGNTHWEDYDSDFLYYVHANQDVQRGSLESIRSVPEYDSYALIEASDVLCPIDAKIFEEDSLFEILGAKR